MSKKSKNPRKGRLEPKAEGVAVETPQPSAVRKASVSKNKRYKDLVVGAGTELWQALEDKDEKKVQKLYKAIQKEWKSTYGDFDPELINQRIRETFWKWEGSYEKVHYDVQLNDGTIVPNCWPNDGFMMTTDGSGGRYTVDDVAGVRIAINPRY